MYLALASQLGLKYVFIVDLCQFRTCAESGDLPLTGLYSGDCLVLSLSFLSFVSVPCTLDGECTTGQA